MKEIRVIGATSPLGIDLVRLLVEDGYTVHASFRSLARVPPAWRAHPSITCEELDVTSPQEVRGFHQRHVVWLAHLNQGRFNDQETETNLQVFNRFLEQVTRSSTEQIVFVSSGGSVYGEPQQLPIPEDHPLQPLSSYGRAKVAMETRLFTHQRTTGIRTAILRPGNIYGFSDPNQDCKGVVAAFLNSMQRRTPFTLIHHGNTVRDFVHVDDVARAIIAAVAHPASHVVWNAATSKGHTIADTIGIIQRLTGLEMPEFIHSDNYSSDVHANILAIDRIRSEASWAPRIELESGLAAMMRNRNR